jgi:hypothetical protein
MQSRRVVCQESTAPGALTCNWVCSTASIQPTGIYVRNRPTSFRVRVTRSFRAIKRPMILLFLESHSPRQRGAMARQHPLQRSRKLRHTVKSRTTDIRQYPRPSLIMLLRLNQRKDGRLYIQTVHARTIKAAARRSVLVWVCGGGTATTGKPNLLKVRWRRPI